MQNYIVFLRGVNVGGKNKLKMVELRSTLETAGFEGVQTYIQSGNILLKSAFDAVILQQKMEALLESSFGIQASVLVRTPKELGSILEALPFDLKHQKQLYFVLFKETVAEKQLRALENIEFSGEHFQLAGKTMYMWYENGAGKAKLTNNFWERLLRQEATTRNYNTMKKLLDMSRG
ncbi:MAG: DUF1697 domain-containing protein [Flavobacteriaceae bacterium]|nr:DUF1697 domain-containing protein [Flavobacteriaceae bacterium]